MPEVVKFPDGTVVQGYYSTSQNTCVAPGTKQTTYAVTRAFTSPPGKPVSVTSHYGGGFVLKNPVVWLLFWGPSWITGTLNTTSIDIVTNVKNICSGGTNVAIWSTATSDYGINAPTFGGAVYNSSTQPTSTTAVTSICQATRPSQSDDMRALMDSIYSGQILSPANNIVSGQYSSTFVIVMQDPVWTHT